MKKLLLILLALALVFSFSACGEGESNASGSLVDSEFVYVPEYFYLEEDGLESLQNIHYHDGMLYFSSYGVVGTREPSAEELEWNNGVVEEWMTEQYGTIFYKANIDGTGLTKLEGFKPMQVPEGMSGDASINSFTLDQEGNIWVAENLYLYSYDENGEWLDGGEQYFLRKLDPTGAEISQIDLAPLTEQMEWFYINGLCVDNEGYVYIGCENKVFALDAASGSTVFELSLAEGEWINTMVRMGGGKVGISMYGAEGGYLIKEIDPATKAFGKTYELPMNAYNLYSGGGDYAVYCSDNSYLYGVNPETGESVALLNWIDSDINSNDMRNVIPLDDGRIVCINSSYDYDENGEYIGKQEFIVLSKTPASEVPEKTILTMATMWLDYNIRTAIIDFNKTNPNYRIQVIDYSQYNTDEDYEAGLTKLNTEIITGNVPDILDTTSLPVQQYAAKGLLEDLYAYIDSDAELSREALVQPALKAMETEGHLYQVSPSFSVNTLIGHPDIVGTEPGWTFDDLKAVMAAHPEASAFSPYVTRDTILYYSYMFNEDKFVDWKTGTCNFESEDFISMLEFAAGFPESYEWSEDDMYVDEAELISQGKILLTFYSLYSFDDLYSSAARFGGDITYIGFPSSDGCGSVLSISNSLAMSSESKNKEAAWSFIRTLFTEEYQQRDAWQFPTNKAVYDKLVKEAMTNETMTNGTHVVENGYEMIQPKYTMVDSSGNEIEVYAMTQEQLDQFEDLLSRIDSTVSYNTKILEIIQEEAALFFDGPKSAEETAKTIQSRVSIYVNE